MPSRAIAETSPAASAMTDVIITHGKISIGAAEPCFERSEAAVVGRSVIAEMD